nr:hypothetical protein [Burkholderia ambifaria]
MNELTGRLKYPAIDLDQHLNRQRGEFVNALRLSELAAAIQEALQQSPVALIAGVCIREVLDRLQCDTVLHIYVQRNSPMGIPGDLDILDIEDGRQLGDMSLLSELDKEIASYHARYCPRRNADVVYVRTGDD